jgi:hypothetical protein
MANDNEVSRFEYGLLHYNWQNDPVYKCYDGHGEIVNGFVIYSSQPTEFENYWEMDEQRAIARRRHMRGNWRNE